MANTPYFELLRDPRWQQKRLRKMEAAEWKCERCLDSETTLNVHHKRYVKGRMPWEYDDAELAVLCEPCHEDEHGQKDLRNELMARLWMDGPLSIDDFVAYGAGAISTYSWLVDDALRVLLERVRNDKPLQYNAGRAGAGLTEIDNSDGRYFMSRKAMEHVADLICVDEEFIVELIDLLLRHGVKLDPKR